MSSANWIRWGGTAGMVGGLLWVSFPLSTALVSLEDTQPGTLAYVATAASYWLMAVLPLLLLLVGLMGLRALIGGADGRLGKVGFLVSFVALALMFFGNGVEVASLTYSGSESAVGHSAFLAGFLALLVGSLLLGVALIRARRDPFSRLGGLVFALALPLGILFAFLGDAVAPGTDIGFWAAITVPYGIAWVLLGYTLSSSRHAVAGRAEDRSAWPRARAAEVEVPGRGGPSRRRSYFVHANSGTCLSLSVASLSRPTS